MANLLVLDSTGATKEKKQSGVGSTGDPFVEWVAAAGDVANGATDAGNPVKIGAKASSTLPGAVSTAQRVNAYADLNGRLMVLPGSQLVAAANFHAPAAATAAVVTYAAGGAGISHVISGVAWSYSAAPTGGNLKIENGAGTTVFTIDITAAGPDSITFPEPMRGSANTALIVTLASGAGAVVGKVNVLGKRLE